MALQVLAALNEDRPVVVEAGTGNLIGRGRFRTAPDEGGFAPEEITLVRRAMEKLGPSGK